MDVPKFDDEEIDGFAQLVALRARRFVCGARRQDWRENREGKAENPVYQLHCWCRFGWVLAWSGSSVGSGRAGAVDGASKVAERRAAVVVEGGEKVMSLIDGTAGRSDSSDVGKASVVRVTWRWSRWGPAAAASAAASAAAAAVTAAPAVVVSAVAAASVTSAAASAISAVTAVVSVATVSAAVSVAAIAAVVIAVATAVAALRLVVIRLLTNVCVNVGEWKGSISDTFNREAGRSVTGRVWREADGASLFSLAGEACAPRAGAGEAGRATVVREARTA